MNNGVGRELNLLEILFEIQVFGFSGEPLKAGQIISKYTPLFSVVAKLSYGLNKSSGLGSSLNCFCYSLLFYKYSLTFVQYVAYWSSIFLNENSSVKPKCLFRLWRSLFLLRSKAGVCQPKKFWQFCYIPNFFRIRTSRLPYYTNMPFQQSTTF